jgi:hypothetical protein
VVDDAAGGATARARGAVPRTGRTRREDCVCYVQHVTASTVGDDDDAFVLLLDPEAAEGVSAMHVERADVALVARAGVIARAAAVCRLSCHAAILYFMER